MENNTFKIVMLPSIDHAPLVLSSGRYGGLFLYNIYGRADEDMGDRYQNIYAISQENPKQGDWYLVRLWGADDSWDYVLEKAEVIDGVWVNSTSEETTRHINNCFKVFGSTEKRMENLVGSEMISSREFLIKYAQAYNDGKEVVSVSSDFSIFYLKNGEKPVEVKSEPALFNKEDLKKAYSGGRIEYNSGMPFDEWFEKTYVKK